MKTVLFSSQQLANGFNFKGFLCKLQTLCFKL